jgi:predicted transcriptional regulator
MTENSSSDDSDMIAWTADIVASHVQNNSVAISDLPVLIKTVHDSLSGLGGENPAEKPQPAVSIRRSITPDFIICLEDGKKLKDSLSCLNADFYTVNNYTKEDFNDLRMALSTHFLSNE